MKVEPESAKAGITLRCPHCHQVSDVKAHIQTLGENISMKWSPSLKKVSQLHIVWHIVVFYFGVSLAMHKA